MSSRVLQHLASHSHALALSLRGSLRYIPYPHLVDVDSLSFDDQLDLLKGDRFLGDADWELVWRYIPVSTAKSYWHRIR